MWNGTGLEESSIANRCGCSLSYSFKHLRPQVSPEEKDRGEQWKGFAGEIRNEVRNVAAKQMHMEETIAALAAQQKHILATLERLLEVNSKTALPEGSRD